MDRNAIRESLEQIRTALHKQFEDEVGTHASRLEQLDHGVANVAASANALFDEEEREVDLAVRYMNDEASSPIAGRGKKQYAIVARRAK